MMICTFTFLALLMDYGHSQFPDSTLNWWTWIFGLLGMVSAILHLCAIYDMRRFFGTMPITVVSPMISDLLAAVVLTFGYSTFVL